MSDRIKLTAGSPKHVSELLDYKCLNCKKNFLIHPTRWKVHLLECLKECSFNELLALREKEENKVTKDFIEHSLLHFHNLVQQ